MTYLVKHSAVRTLLRYIASGKISYRRGATPKNISPASTSLSSATPRHSGSRDDVSDPEKEEVGIAVTNIVDWSGPEDPSNPQNWPFYQKLTITAVLCFWTFALYVGSSIYTSSQQHVIEIFGVTHAEGALGIALYVLGYGAGSLLFSPLSEVPAIGRNPSYAVSGFFFVILCIPTALVNNYPGLMVLRFLLGFMCGPCLGIVGASFGDIWSPAPFCYSIALWSMAATAGPAMGPTLSSYAVKALGWRFSSWELLMISGPFYIMMVVFLPETSAPTILYYEAKRRREETGNMELVSQAELKQRDLHAGALLWDALVKPWVLNVKDPALGFTTLYLGLAYGIFYSFFESLPIVYPHDFGFSATSTGLVFLAVLPAGTIAFVIQYVYLKYRVFPALFSGSFGEVENHLLPGVLASPLMPIGLFIYAWTAREEGSHWVAPTIGFGLIIIGVYFIFQSILLYIPNIYPRYAASIFAANSLARSLLAFAAILIARPMFEKMGINGGVSFLAGLMVLCMFGIAAIYKWGKVLRMRSKFAVA
ncbi:MFS general substrate transporter [Bimuria novae-zelandiae CBS 107.79]|uniref:MFS general substrate transporter n=1 Tax=Bimuria novae-zelandiae CBS 107.79 TaxID=1447943 RepID=A0A6A5UIY2_9PLEO|nr:MFS general substrate transporter [Bimuria novae-zelandiae CBS 107.79]